MEKYIRAAEATVKVMEMIATAVILILVTTSIYGIICFERWQRPEEVKKITESVDTNMTSV